MRDGSRFGKPNRFTDYDYIIQHPIIRFQVCMRYMTTDPFLFSIHRSIKTVRSI